MICVWGEKGEKYVDQPNYGQLLASLKLWLPFGLCKHLEQIVKDINVVDSAVTEASDVMLVWEKAGT